MISDRGTVNQMINRADNTAVMNAFPRHNRGMNVSIRKIKSWWTSSLKRSQESNIVEAVRRVSACFSCWLQYSWIWHQCDVMTLTSLVPWLCVFLIVCVCVCTHCVCVWCPRSRTGWWSECCSRWNSAESPCCSAGRPNSTHPTLTPADPGPSTTERRRGGAYFTFKYSK